MQILILMEITGKITKIMDAQTFSSGFTKREVIVTTQEQYPQPIAVEFLQDKVDLVNELNVGDDVKVSINLRGREWTNPEGVTRYFNSIVAWRVEKIMSENISASSGAPTNTGFKSETGDLGKDEEIDDLPF